MKSLNFNIVELICRIGLVGILSLGFITIIGTGLYGCAEKKSTATVALKAKALFSPENPIVGGEIVFNAGSSQTGGPGKTIASFEWDFESDGNFDATGITTTWVYTKSGTYSVLLRVTDNDGLTSDVNFIVTVSDGNKPIAKFTIDPASPLPRQTIIFNASGSNAPSGISKYEWDFNYDFRNLTPSFDENVSGANPSHVYSTPGIYFVLLRVTDNTGHTAQSTQTLTIPDVILTGEPTASFVYDPAKPVAGQHITFIDTSVASSVGGYILEDNWNFADQYSTLGGEVNYSFTAPGTYAVTLQISDNDGKNAQVTRSIEVAAATLAPKALFTVSETNITAGDSITVDGSPSTGDNIVNYQWDFNGDGSFDTSSANSQFKFSEAGTYHVRLRVTNAEGYSGEVIHQVKVAAGPIVGVTPTARISMEKTTFEANKNVYASAGESTANDVYGTITKYEWDYTNDGTFDNTGIAIAYSYPEPGTYTLRLRVTNNSNMTAESTKIVTITPEIKPWIAASLTAGASHVCGVEVSSSNTYCWGLNADGQLGDGSNTNRATPTLLKFNLTFGSSLEAGGTHTCGIASDQNLYCWGNNTFGQLGDNTQTSQNEPTLVSDTIRFSSVSLGENHTCALDQSNHAYCWGRNTTGQLGDKSQTDRAVPTQVSGGLTFTSLVAGSQHTCGTVIDYSNGKYSVYCWGLNSDGQLGDGTTTNQNEPTKVDINKELNVASAGEKFTCGNDVHSSELYCWGNNEVGQLGDDTTTSSLTPVLVYNDSSNTFGIVESGAQHSCAYLGGNIYCWGDNTFGSLGNNSVISSSRPVAIDGDLSMNSALAVGKSFSCASKQIEGVTCWGENDSGQLGIGTTGGFRKTPTTVSMP